jgi:glycosyltransferase involved in cell wall biosynthesis
MKELSILIPARNEMFLKNTIEDILLKIEADTEIITVLDGQWADPPLTQDERLNVVYLSRSIGQRAATNLACKLSKAKYVMKVDAHCAFDKGFDRKMIEKMQDHYTMAPIMRNLWVFDWKCMKCGKRWYMGPEPTKCENPECDSKVFTRKIKWKAKSNPLSYSYRFNRDLEFKYWQEYKNKQVGDVVDTLSLQGSCFMCTRDKYWELDLCDDSWGSWGGQGAEVALKTWLSGGEVKVNKNTWYAHMFRTQPGFSFPYPNPAKEQVKAKNTLRETFLNDKWPKAKHKLKWLIDKFSPPEWEDYK